MKHFTLFVFNVFFRVILAFVGILIAVGAQTVAHVQPDYWRAAIASLATIILLDSAAITGRQAKEV